jgi:hypothetical protein
MGRLLLHLNTVDVLGKDLANCFVDVHCMRSGSPAARMCWHVTPTCSGTNDDNRVTHTAHIC